MSHSNNENITIKFKVESNLFFRQGVNADITGKAFLEGLEVQTYENKGLFSSTTLYRVSGKSPQVMNFTHWFKDYAEVQGSPISSTFERSKPLYEMLLMNPVRRA